MDAAVVMLTKPPVAGRVKTRLIGALDAAETARLHWAFVEDLAAELNRGAFSLAVAWALESGEQPPRVDGQPFAAETTQIGSSLGDRLFYALSELGKRYRLLAAVGSDHPELEASTVERGFERLRTREVDVVLGPSDDGGYYLFGLRSEALDERLFQGVAWSTESVLEQTRERCRELGLRVGLLDVVADIDTPEDLRRLCDRLRALGGRASAPARGLATGARALAPRTRLLLEEWSWL